MAEKKKNNTPKTTTKKSNSKKTDNIKKTNNVVKETKKEKNIKKLAEIKEDKKEARIVEVKEQNMFLRFLREVWIYLVIIVVILGLKVYVVSPIRVNGRSMVDTLQDQDIMILNKIVYKFSDIQRFDIVVIKGREINGKKEEDLIKRVIGLPGEHIAYKGNKLYVNGKEIPENFSHNKTDDFDIDELESHTVPKDTYFVLGDNRAGSLDSRVLGFIHKDIIMGRAKFTVFPFNRWGEKK